MQIYSQKLIWFCYQENLTYQSKHRYGQGLKTVLEISTNNQI